MSATQSHPVFPPLDGSLLLPDTLAFHEQHNADLPVYVWKEDGANDMTELSFKDFAQACRRVARTLDRRIDISSRPVVAVIALADTLVYQTVVTGMIFAGIVPFPISPRNTPAAIAHLMKKTSCHAIVSTCTTLKDLMESVEVEFKNTDPDYEIAITEIPSLYQLYPQYSDTPINDGLDALTISADSYQPVVKPEDVAVYLHSSGSTGLPKPIPKSHRILVEHITAPICVNFRQFPRARVPTMHMPPFHAMGFILEVTLPLYTCAVIALFPPMVKRADIVPRMATPDIILDQIRKTESTALIILPTYLQTWASDNEAIDTLRKLEFVSFSGGAISPGVGQHMRARGVKLGTVYGATEVGAVAMSDPNSNDEDWEYMEFAPHFSIRWVPQGEGTFECQVLNNDALHLEVINLPGGEGYATSDMFKAHPTKKGLWKLIGRVDDVIIHSSGEKTVPPPMEFIMLNSPDIIGAVMFGHAHIQPGVLIEPAPKHQIDVSSMEQVAQFRNLIWPIIEEANSVAPAFSKIFKELILIADYKKPLPRAAKGTVQRKEALRIYSEEIEKLFSTVESVQATESIAPPSAWTKQYVTQWILDQAHDLGLTKTADTSKNLFEQGFDSLNATILRRRITGAITSIESDAGKAALQSIHQNLIYSYPTVDSLSAHIVELVNSDTSATSTSNAQSHIEVIEEMIEKYRFKTPLASPSDNKSNSSEVVILTGSTGFLGSEVLDRLLRNPRVSTVYALNRPSAGKASISERHLQRFHDKGLDEELLKSPKLKYIESDYSQDSLGLQASLYAELQQSVTCIIHNAWRLDFNLSVASFESNIRGTHNLATLARSSAHGSKVKFIFTSSIGTAQSWDPSLGTYPEELVLDARYAVGNGYGEGKYITDRMLTTSGLNVTSLRIGQITGSRTSGAWATSDWVPIFVKSSIALGALPTTSGVVSWLPMDAVTDCVEALVTSDDQYPPALNIVHPNVIEWNVVVKHIQASVKSIRGISLELLPFREWFSKLESRGSSATAKDMADIPAIKLLDFFENLAKGDSFNVPPNSEALGFANFATEKMQSINKGFATLPQLTQDDADKWLTYWTAAGLFN